MRLATRGGAGEPVRSAPQRGGNRAVDDRATACENTPRVGVAQRIAPNRSGEPFIPESKQRTGRTAPDQRSGQVLEAEVPGTGQHGLRDLATEVLLISIPVMRWSPAPREDSRPVRQKIA